MEAAREILTAWRCTAELQERFIALSGDRNPIHADPVAARRTLAGGQVVHGLHVALAALEALLGRGGEQGVTGLSAQFLKPVLVGDAIHFRLGPVKGESRQIAALLNDEVLTRITLRFGPTSPSSAVLPALVPEPLLEPPLPEAPGEAGDVVLGLDPELATALFPLGAQALGQLGLGELLALTRLVGMRYPGRHSLFGSFDVRFDGTDESPVLRYQVEEVDDRFRRVFLRLEGPRLRGKAEAFFRPPPEQQAGMEEVARQVPADAYADTVALIIGGSRGLGEMTAKIIAAGGGLPIITYHAGAADAAAVAAQIHAWGGRCEVRQFSAERGGEGLQTFCDGLPAALTSLYYFATPHIFGRRGFFDHDLLREFCEVYVNGFGTLLDALLRRRETPLRVLYPSSVSVVENPRALAEYTIAKRSGEDLCAFYHQHSRHVKIWIERFPRTKTDQTATLLSAPAQDSLDVLLPLVAEIERR